MQDRQGTPLRFVIRALASIKRACVGCVVDVHLRAFGTRFNQAVARTKQKGIPKDAFLLGAGDRI